METDEGREEVLDFVMDATITDTDGDELNDSEEATLGAHLVNLLRVD